MLSVSFETLGIHTGSEKHVDSIFVHVQILKYLQHKLSTAAETCIILKQAHLHINVSYCKENKL